MYPHMCIHIDIYIHLHIYVYIPLECLQLLLENILPEQVMAKNRDKVSLEPNTD
jgi:hypothetical protein